MYEAFYGFREKPFHVTADPAFLYLSKHHQEALDHLVYGIRQRLGFIVITGEVGTGKTTLAKQLVDQLQFPTKTALILNPSLSGTQLMRAILQDFGVTPTTRVGRSRGELLGAIERFLLQLAEEGNTGVLIIDEAQALGTPALEQVRLLSTVETAKSKLLQIVLVGQPELEERLNRDPRLRALQQRVAVRYRIQPLDEADVAAYIQHRLEVAEAEHPPRFTGGTISRIARLSFGFPRRINLLCDQVLLAGFVRDTHTIDEAVLEAALSTSGTEQREEEPAWS